MLKNSHALLTVEGLPKMGKKSRTLLAAWLKGVAKEIEAENPKVYANPCRFRLMK